MLLYYFFFPPLKIMFIIIPWNELIHKITHSGDKNYPNNISKKKNDCHRKNK